MPWFYYLTYVVCYLFSIAFFPLRVLGRENLPRRGAYILASNHCSHLDPVILGFSARRLLGYMAKDSLFKNPIFGWIITALGAFPLRREKADIGSLKEAIDRLERGNGLVIFPQGTRCAAVDAKTPAYPGIGFLVAKTGVPVIPAYLEGSDKVLPAKSKKVRRHPVTLIIGKPITFAKTLSHQEIADQVMAKVVSLKPA